VSKIAFRGVFSHSVGMILACLVAAVALGQPAGSANPFVGQWAANIAKSQLRPNAQIQSESLRFDVARPGTVSISDSVITTSGREIGQGTTTFQVDGEVHPHDELLPGLVVVTRWRGPRLLETTLTRTDGQIDRVTYEVSANGQTLTVKTEGPLGGQLIVFERR
jgi:hypothetical protein